jgi:hypothetical protein
MNYFAIFRGNIMGVQIHWDNPQKTTLRYDFTGRWTWDEFYAAYDVAKPMMMSVTHKVDFILNSSDDVSRRYTPPNAMTHMLSIARKALPNAGKCVSVNNGSAFRRVLLTMVTKVNPKIAEVYVFAKTLEEARAMLAQDSVTI